MEPKKNEFVFNLHFLFCHGPLKLSFTSCFFLHEAAFVRTDTRSPSEVLPQDGNVEQYVRRIAWFAFTLGKAKPINCCPPYESFLKHVRRSSIMSSTCDRAGSKRRCRNWSTRLRGGLWVLEGNDKDAPLAAGNLVIELFEHCCHVYTDRKTRLLTCSCDPEKAAKDNHRCQRCSCKGKTWSLQCECKGRFPVGLSPSAVASTNADSEGRDAEGGAEESNVGKASDGHASGGGAQLGGLTLTDISSGGDSGLLGWISSDSDSDHASVADIEASFDVGGRMGGGGSWADHMDEEDI